MKSARQIVKLSLFIIFLALSGCTQNNQQPKVEQEKQLEQIIPHQTSLTGSLVTDFENTPDQFFKMAINDRSQFTDKRTEKNGKLEQVISNPDQSLIIVAIWENFNKSWRCLGMTISQSDQITSDTTQVFLRLPYRLNDSSGVRNAIQNNTAYTKLANGAGLTIEQKENRINYLIY